MKHLKPINKKKLIKILFYCFIIFCIILHIFYHLITSCYLITSGIFLIIVLSVVLYYLFVWVNKFFRQKLDNKNIKLLFTSIALGLIFFESILILKGINSTYSEKKSLYYYQTPYSIFNKNEQLHIWKFDHDLKTNEFCYHRKINSEGLPDIEHPIIKKPNEYRIFGLGDSFTEGDGTDLDSTWLRFLERSLKKYSLKKDISYFNAGVCGSDPFFEYLLLKNRLLKYKPDLIFIAINCSDIYDILSRGGIERFSKDGTLVYKKPPFWEPLFAISHLSRLFFSALGYNEYFIQENEKNIEFANEKIAECINMFNELSKKSGFKLIVIIHPCKSEFEVDKPSLSSALEKIRKENIEVLNMYDYFKEKENVNKFNYSNLFWKYDGHHNAKGYELFARGVEWKLNEMGIIDSLKKD